MGFYHSRQQYRIGACSVIIFFLGIFVCKAQGTWVPLNNVAPDYNSGVMLLLTDGTVMCKTSSGGSGNGTVWDRLTPDSHGSYVNGTWTSFAPMNYDRLYFSTQVLKDGRVYVAGGEYGTGGTYSEVFDPVANTWTMCPQIVYTMAGKISDANSEILPDGRILQAVVDSGVNFIWDPVSNTYSPAATCLRWDNEAPWAKLPDNSILFLDNYGTTSERYIPATQTWINDALAPVELFDPWGFEAGGSFLLPNGQVFFIGSTPTTAYYTPSGTTSPGTWTTGPIIPSTEGAPDAASAICVDGHILMALSATPDSLDHFPTPTNFYDFDYTTNTFTLVGCPGGGTTMPMSSYLTNMLALPDGTILYATQGDDQYYEYVPGNPPLAAGKPTVSSVSMLSCDTFMATGTLFNGINEGASYGDDWQMETNYPLIRLVSGTNVYYATTYNWNSTGVMRGSLPDTVTFVLPAGLPSGTNYGLEVVTNGIASSDFSFDPDFHNTPASFSVCAGHTFTVSNTWSGGVWSSGNAAIASVGSSSGIVSTGTPGTTTVSYTVGACVATTAVTVNTMAPAITPVGGAIVCVGSSVTLHDTLSGGSWSIDNPAIASVNPVLGTLTGSTAGTANVTYALGACFAVEPATVNPLPSAAITASGATNICPGGSVRLSATSGTGYTYQWRLNSVAVAGATNASYTASAAGIYSVVVSTPQGCSRLSAGATVSIISMPSASVTASGPTTFCAGGNVTLNANTGASLSYQWQVGGSPIPGATSIGYTTSASGNYDVVERDGSTGCTSTSSLVSVSVSPTPVIVPTVSIAASAGTSFCVTASPTTFTATGGPAPSFQWFLNGVLAGAGSSYTLAAPLASDIISCVMTSSNICALPTTATARDTITVNARVHPSVSIASTPSVICNDVPVTFTAVPVYGGTSPFILWAKNSVSVATGPAYSYTPSPGDELKCSIVSNFGCVITPDASDSININVQPSYINSISIRVSESASADTFVASVTSGVAAHYQWLVNGSPVAGATNAVYITGSLPRGAVVSCKEMSRQSCVSPDSVVSVGIAVGATSVQQVNTNEAGFTLQPNPNNGGFVIEGALNTTADDQVCIVITDMLGQVVYKKVASARNGLLHQDVAMGSAIANGMYIVTVTSGAAHGVFHMIVSR